jgi:hypothetical protein
LWKVAKPGLHAGKFTALAESGWRLQDDGEFVSMRRARNTSHVFFSLPFVVAILVTVIGCGPGLLGIVHALATVDHVCTCAGGGSHASCPVCNPTLNREHRSHVRVFDGAPCGEGRLAVDVATDPALIPDARLASAASVSGIENFPQASGAPPEAFVEPCTPPPRFALV